MLIVVAISKNIKTSDCFPVLFIYSVTNLDIKNEPTKAKPANQRISKIEIFPCNKTPIKDPNIVKITKNPVVKVEYFGGI